MASRRATVQDADRMVRTAVLVLVVVVVAVVMIVRAVTQPPKVSIAGTLVAPAPCFLMSSATAEISAGGEVIDSASVGSWDSSGEVCTAPIAANSLPDHDEYTVTVDGMEATVPVSSVYEGMTISLTREEL